MSDKDIAEAITGALTSPRLLEPHWQDTNIVDGLYALARAVDRLAAQQHYATAMTDSVTLACRCGDLVLLQNWGAHSGAAG